MQDFDLNLLRLQYEILNVPLERVAASADLPLVLLQEHAVEEGWKPYWPESDLITPPPVEGADPLSEDDILTSQAELYSARTRTRLQVYALAKELYMASKFAQLEASIIGKALDVVSTMTENADPAAVRMLSSLHKDMTSKLQSLAISLGADEGGMPTAIIRDLTGR
jgi:ribosomal protein L16 Arg81 hydroxylase